jgi:glutamine---fructose-6-phosphate transaminase (isomerizing)
MTEGWFDRELREQPAALERAIASARGVAAEVGGELERSPAPFALVAARGSSDNVARYAQYLFGSILRLPVALAAPSLSAGEAAAGPPRMDGGLVLGISQSGRSPDIVGVLAGAGGADGRTIAITNDPGSPLAAEARWVIGLDAGAERAVPATKTVTSSLSAVAALAAALPGTPKDSFDLGALPDQVAATLDAALAGVAAFEPLMDAAHVVSIGRGVHLASATETALKIRELAGVVGEAFSPPDLMHGPIAAVGKATVVIAIAPAEASTAAAVAEATTRGARGGLVAPEDEPVAIGLAADGRPRLTWPASVSPLLAPIPAIVVGQAIARHWAIRIGADLDAPHGLSKVTLTA